jgi:hypothetical protein
LKVIFLHLPKTAGQSVHLALTHGFGEDRVCPARTNEQLYQMSINELNRYQVFSGHLDWAMLDCIKGPKYVFTILREPIKRILSFYFFLRDEASQLPQEDRLKPAHMGLNAAIELETSEYFLGGNQGVRNFLDTYYDNVYTYYFAGRGFAARNQLRELISRGALSKSALLDMAKQNLGTLDDVFSVNDMSQVFSKIRAISDAKIDQDEKYYINANKNVSEDDRIAQIVKLGADEKALARIREMCVLDDEIWKDYQSPPLRDEPKGQKDEPKGQNSLLNGVIRMFSK